MYSPITQSLALCLCFGLPFGLAAQSDPPESKQQLPTTVPDVVEVRNGGEIAGDLLSDNYLDPQSGKTMLALRTPAGGEVLLEKGKASPKFKSEMALVVKDYENRLASMTNTAEANWELHDWLKSNTTTRAIFGPQIEFHLKRICQLDPNDERARRLLGLRKFNGQWIDEVALNAAYGYESQGSRWRSTLESQIDEYETGQEMIGKEANAEWNRFKSQVSTMDQAEIPSKIKAMVTPALTGKLIEEAKKPDTNIAWRRLLIDAFSTQQGVEITNALLYFAINDSDPGIQDLALTLLEQPGVDRISVANNATQGLFLDDNVKVNRTAVVLGKLGDTVAVLPLVKSIVTEHTVATGATPGRMNFSQGSGPGSSGGGMTIDNSPATVRKKFVNRGVLDALRRITKQNLGDDPALWMEWYLRNFTLAGAEVRRDR